MKIKEANYSYGISYGQDNPYIIGIACIIAAVALAIPFVFALCLSSGIIKMSPKGVIISISMYAGLLTIALILSMTIPKFRQAANAVKITGSVVNFKSIINKYGHVYYPIVKYEYNGQPYTIQLDSWSSSQPSIGSEIPIRVNPKKPHKLVTKGELVFSIIALVIFTCAGILFCSIGFMANESNTQINTEALSTNSGDMSIGLIIWISFIAFWLLLGIIICVVTRIRHGKHSLKETGIKTTCLIIDVNVNTSVEINGENPVKLTCSDKDKTFTVKAKASPGEYKYRTGNKIDIYFDPNNSKKFFADLDSVR
ncbi:MAG: DUF3592 domain-containing protein [Treponemataceae bacterium]|nr:DUF3592 domain-containing protein [Treponemataceae bacterium]